MNFNDQELFKGKTFSSLLKDIYTTTKNKEQQIKEYYLYGVKMKKDEWEKKRKFS